MVRCRFVLGLLLCLVSATPSVAALVTPVDATASSAFAIPATAMIDGSGLSGVGSVETQTHDTNENNMWIAGNGTQAQNESIEFILDQNYDLTSALVWNYNGVDGFGTDNSLRGVDELEIFVSSGLQGSFSSVGTFNLAQANPFLTPDLPAETVLLNGATNVRRVMFDINSAHGGATQEFVGLSEVRFDGTAVPPADERAWFADALGDWNDGINWEPSFPPNANTHTATFGGVITASRTVVTDEAVTVKAINFENTNSYVIAGAGSVTLEADSGNAAIQVTGGGSAGSHQFQAVVEVASATDITIGDGAELVFNNAFNLNGNTVTKTGAGTLTINNQLGGGGGLLDASGGRLEGSGTVGGSLEVRSTVVSPTGIMQVNGDYTQRSSASLEIGVGGTTAGDGYDQLNVSGTADLTGDLTLTPEGSYQDPAARGQTDELDVLVASMLNGTFDSIDYDGEALSSGTNYVGTNQNGDDGLFRIVQYDSDGGVTVTNYLAEIGDANGDRVIDGQDFVIWNSNKFTAGNGWTDGDFNGDGIVDGQDFVLWNGNKFTSVDGVSVPEPGFAWAMACAALVIGVCRRRAAR